MKIIIIQAKKTSSRAQKTKEVHKEPVTLSELRLTDRQAWPESNKELS